MKPAPFALSPPTSLAEAQATLRAAPEARAIAGGQSLGPMLNLRLARPERLVPIAALPELTGAEAAADHITLGAAITHAAIADGRTPDLPGALLARIAEGIAYRAVRNRGTIGGSLCHADPAADWPCTLLALGAAVLVAGDNGIRAVTLDDFLRAPFQVALAPGDLVLAVRIPRPSSSARWGYVKACRKPGAFASAMAAVLIDPARGLRRAVIGATGGRPLLLHGDAAQPGPADAALRSSGLDDIARQRQCVVLRRALRQADTSP